MNFKKLKQKFRPFFFFFVVPSVLNISAYQSGFQSDELKTSMEVTGGNKAFSVQTECEIVSLVGACVLA